jgi:hypothetical protein
MAPKRVSTSSEDLVMLSMDAFIFLSIVAVVFD